ncbi:polyribonucleotide nucleotidyltransferase [Candidatus Schneideria nysicola]|uniref:polyribonucleotide nucleotidyltransferase n=1 Tax=Candidatus Schneideria nysicola TaxID=1081631 RepID=UPI001CAA68A3|nr:polyribonucleotide nucleotidyltransferase [Candidatus Schneideria nysicola]UAJ64828.1 polyribonucleotide nucleotidyltransferase [Candidatus Schneideria nysicola]
MLHSIIQKFQYGNSIVKIETGLIARQSTASVMITIDETSILVTMVVAKKQKSEQDFFPLTINYQERTYAAGRIPGGFFRREGRPSENEILVSRLIDRPLRPLFSSSFLNEVQLTATVVSVGPQISPDIVAIIGSSAVISISGIPFYGPVGAARIGYVNKQYILNPNSEELNKSSLDLVISSTADAIVMIESASQFLNEEELLNAIIFGHKQQEIVIQNINELVNKVNKPNWTLVSSEETKTALIRQRIKELAAERIEEISLNIPNKKERSDEMDIIKSNILEIVNTEDNSVDINEIKKLLDRLEKDIIRDIILNRMYRLDKRKFNEIRNIDIRVGILPRTHGSALFTRGNTQALVTTTLGTNRDAQNVDELSGEYTDHFILHYNFPPYCVGEIGMMTSPKRREIGHGRLAKRSLLPVMPKINEFPYTIRVVSEITESDGSSSMASVCGASLALMDAGIPIKYPIAGIAMGLIKEDKKFIVLSDIAGEEDRIGDMDFKIAGSYNGITALQMDSKILEISVEIIRTALKQAKIALFRILDLMGKSINIPRKEISKYAPHIYTIKINPNKIRDLIGKGGTIIRALTEETGTTIEIEDDGSVKIATSDRNKAHYTISRIQEITAEIKIGDIYSGKITRIVDFGAFVTINKVNKEGLVHISQISNIRRLKIGQEVTIKVLNIDRQGRIRLSIKEALS